MQKVISSNLYAYIFGSSVDGGHLATGCSDFECSNWADELIQRGLDFCIPVAICVMILINAIIIYKYLTKTKILNGIHKKIPRPKFIPKRLPKEIIALIISICFAVIVTFVKGYLFSGKSIDISDNTLLNTLISIFPFFILSLYTGVIAIIDYIKNIIPNNLLIALLGNAFVILLSYRVYSSESYSRSSSSDFQNFLIDKLVGFLVGFVVFFLARIVSKGGLGAGDVKYFAVVGFILGIPSLLTYIFYTLISSAVVSIILLVTKKKSHKDRIPLGPFLIPGLLIMSLT